MLFREKQVNLLVAAVGLVSFLFLIAPNCSLAVEDATSHADSLTEVIVELRHEGKYIEALGIARNLLDTLGQDSDKKSWMIDDTERLISTLEFVSGLPNHVQQELSEADRLTVDIEECMEKREYGKGLHLVGRQLEIRKRHLGEQHYETAVSLGDFAFLLMKSGDYASAQPLYEQALRIRKKVLGPEHPDVASSLNDIATMLLETGDYTGARSLYEQTLRIREKVFGPEHPDVASNLNNIAVLLKKIGDYSGAIALYKQALKIWECNLGPEHPWIATGMHNLACLLSQIGNYAGARPLYEQALKIWTKNFGAEHPTVATGLHNFANMLCKAGDYTNAKPLCERALKIRKDTLGPEHPDVARSLNCLALLLYKTGEYSGAKPLLEQALDIRKNTLGPEHPDVAESLTNLASLLRQTGDYSGAQLLYEKSLTIWRNTLGPEHPCVAANMQKLAKLLWNTKNTALAESYLSQASEAFEAARLRVGTGFMRATFQSSPYSSLAALRLSLGKSDEAWPTAERALGRVLADLLIVSDHRSLTPSESAREDSLKKILSEFENQLTALQNATRTDTTGKAIKRSEEIRLRMLGAEAEWSAFQRDIAAKYPVTEGRAFQLDRVQKILAEETALIGWLYEEIGFEEFVSWGYVIRNTGDVNWSRLGPLHGTTDDHSPVEKVRDFRKALIIAASWKERVREVSELNSLAFDIWAEWIAPLTPYLKGVENLIVIPSDPMLGIPVEALVDSTGAYIGECYAISYTPSATVYTWLCEQRTERVATMPRNALLLGDPPFTAAHLAAMEQEQKTEELIPAPEESFPESLMLRSTLAGNEEMLSLLPRLPWTREETKRVYAVMPEGIILLGPEASEQELINLVESETLQGFNTIHLATHALVDDEAPERSALVLSRVNLPDPLKAAKAGERNFDGLLTAQEIVREWELNADLVTLSGCQTALGREVAGEGYIGLAHAFLQAGARSLVVSLWRVEDEATALLMGRFYENLTGAHQDERHARKGEPMIKAEALREAKHWLRTYSDTNGSQPFKHPVYWSGFVLIGDPR